MNIGIILPHAGPAQLSFITINQCNVGSALTGDSFFGFTKSMGPSCIQPAFSIMNISEVAGFNGIIIATDLESAELILNTHMHKDTKRVFYVWDLEFIRNKKNFRKNVEIYRNPKLELIVRSGEHARVIDNYCNRTPKVVQNFNVLAIREMLTGKEYEFRRQLR